MYKENRWFSVLLVLLLLAGAIMGSRLEIRWPAEEEKEEAWSSIKVTTLHYSCSQKNVTISFYPHRQ